ncbi:beta-glucuronidase [Paenibacillus sp. WQ 127069]|uniref:Beta-glucuronidase n=1 Tax=Paenibacillus baimaensis TaxID=2982185 RepID=A0ABT2UH35_9BACL|nr:glycoside hydrolase family 2 TIM barrel-domain containing protein [Paenibacillus sp. WQ 127069]MCU6793915.1 beta-glucuronidase [Paenibacillus sp. WQ 127069]
MIRLFETNQLRQVTELEGMWDFAVIEQAAQGSNDNTDSPSSMVAGSDTITTAEPDYGYRLPVPGCWEQHPELLTYRGKGLYRRRIVIAKEAAALRFVFKGVSHTARVFFDGKLIAAHYNAYTAFAAVVRHVMPGEHTLTIEVDNSFHEGSALHIPNDYYTYGGLIRPVVMETINELYIERIGFIPQLQHGEWSARIEVAVRNVSVVEQSFQLRGELAGQQLQWDTASIQPGAELVVVGSFQVPDAKAWSARHPQLYALSCQLFASNGEPVEGLTAVDDLIERVGFRTVTTLEGRIQVNGEDIVLKGFNRHEDHPIVGAAFPLALMVKDLDLMADMGANCVRTSHYPNDERFLDLCDERGFYVWEENHARGLSLERMQNPHFIEQCAMVNKEMVEGHQNHPAIIIWAILNECASDTEEGRAHYKRQLEQIRKMDGSRPLTFASHHREKELCFDLADIVSFNLYPGWYGAEDPGELCDRARGWADAAGGLGKPMIMSEFGGDGFYGYRSPSRVKGTEERQADIIDSNLQAYGERDYISGMLIWQFCDCRVSEEGSWAIWRAQTKNSKGIVDEYRRPKLAYEIVRKHFKKISTTRD